MINIVCFTDGSCDNMKKDKGGIGVYFPDHDKYSTSEVYENNCTNQKMGLIACIRAIEITIQNFEKKDWDLTIYSDSMYTINCAILWSKTWIKYGWKKKNNDDIENLSLIKKLYQLAQLYNVNFKHVRSHQREPSNKKSVDWLLWNGNKQADLLARNH